MQYDRLADELKPVVTKDASGNEVYSMSETFKVLRKLHRIRFIVTHRGKSVQDKEYTLKSFAWSHRYGKDGGNAKNVTFEMRQEDGKTRQISVFDYFQERYDIRLQHWRLPIMETARGGLFPMEVCFMPRYNRYPFKLDSWQVCFDIRTLYCME